MNKGFMTLGMCIMIALSGIAGMYVADGNAQKEFSNNVHQEEFYN